VLYHGETLLNGFKRIRIERDDIHARLMRNYPEVPDWWYGVAFGTFFAVAVVATEVWNTGVPAYALVLSVLLPVVYVLPSGFIYAMTGQGVRAKVSQWLPLLTFVEDHHQYSCPNHTGDALTRPAIREYGL
jgi:hypothetical protein